MKLTTPSQFWADIVEASGAADRQKREKLLRVTAENLVSLSRRIQTANEQFRGQMKAGGKNAERLSLQTLPAIEPEAVRPADRAPDMQLKPMQVILFGVVSKAVHNIGVGLQRVNGWGRDDPRVQECRALRDRLVKHHASLEFRSLAQWKEGTTYDEWWRSTCKALSKDERVDMDATLRDTWAFVRAQFLGAKKGLLTDSESKMAILNSVAVLSAQLNQTAPAEVVEGRISDFLKKYERPISVSAAAIAAGTAGAAVVAQNASVGGIAGAVAAAAAGAYATYKGVRRTLRETEDEIENSGARP